jgi:hypothetical protein
MALAERITRVPAAASLTGLRFPNSVTNLWVAGSVERVSTLPSTVPVTQVVGLTQPNAGFMSASEGAGFPVRRGIRAGRPVDALVARG